ncbi:ICMT-domain-containing protein [Trametes punicea]|nr:ICMT-domain-containing protein [Trametes punicea]
MLSPTAFKVLALVVAMLAEDIVYKSPNPPPRKEEARPYGGGDILGDALAAGMYLVIAFAWSIHACEIVAILARDARTPLSPSILSALFANPSAANDLSVHPVFVVGIALLVFGAVVRKACYNTLGRHFTFQLAILKEHKLVTWGPYSVVRHPAYTGGLAALVGMLCAHFAPGGWLVSSGVLGTLLGRVMTGGWVAWVVFMIVGTVRRVPKEDAVLRKEFRDQWDEWARKTPYALIPYVY